MPSPPVSVSYSTFDTPLGECLIARTGLGLCAVSFGKPEDIFERKFVRWPDVRFVKVDDIFPEAQEQLISFLAGDLRNFDLPLDLSIGTEFQQRVWMTLRNIPYGETRSYGWLAEQIGSPKAYRAAGGANGANPIPVIVPCHRVIAADGKIGGYTGGLVLKRKLLKLEGVAL